LPNASWEIILLECVPKFTICLDRRRGGGSPKEIPSHAAGRKTDPLQYCSGSFENRFPGHLTFSLLVIWPAPTNRMGTPAFRVVHRNPADASPKVFRRNA
jgi:hypothetical protein